MQRHLRSNNPQALRTGTNWYNIGTNDNALVKARVGPKCSDKHSIVCSNLFLRQLNQTWVKIECRLYSNNKYDENQRELKLNERKSQLNQGNHQLRGGFMTVS